MTLFDSDLSSLSSAPPSDEESSAMSIEMSAGITKYFKKERSPPPPQQKREPSPPHEYVLADNPNIAFVVMFRARFHEVFPRSTPHFGPQDIERGAVEQPPGSHIERLLCAFLGLVLNRKKEVERNHYTRPLEDAVQAHAAQWPKEWEGKNPLRGGNSFATMSPESRILLLKSLALWCLSSSEAVQAKIKESYKQARHDDDLNQPLSVQHWGRDGLKRRYWLIEGMDDTHFRLYRESNPALKNVTWWSVAGNIPELRRVAEKLGDERSINSKRLREKINSAIPRFEASEEKKQKRRDYRIARKAAFTRPEPGMSLYEGRTRGKKLKYTFEDEDIFSDDPVSTRRSTRNTSGVSTPVEPEALRFSSSGRQIRTRAGTLYGATRLASQVEGSRCTDRPRRTRMATRANNYTDYGIIDDTSGASEAGGSSGNEWEGDDEEDENGNENELNETNADDKDETLVDGDAESLVVQLRYGKREARSSFGSDCLEGELTPNPEISTQGKAESVSDTKKVSLFALQRSVSEHQSTVLEDSKESISKELHIPATDNTGTVNAAEPVGLGPVLRNGEDVAV